MRSLKVVCRLSGVVTRCATFASSAGGADILQRTSLYEWHQQQGGKLVPFAGYELPVQYENLGVLKEHLHTRAPLSSSIFDVSHMGQIRLVIVAIIALNLCY